MALPDWLERQVREAQERARAPPMPTVTAAEMTKSIIASLVEPQIHNEMNNTDFYRMLASKLREVLMDEDAANMEVMAAASEVDSATLIELLEKLRR